MIMPGLCPGSWFSSIWKAKLGKISTRKPLQLQETAQKLANRAIFRSLLGLTD